MSIVTIIILIIGVLLILIPPAIKIFFNEDLSVKVMYGISSTGLILIIISWLLSKKTQISNITKCDICPTGPQGLEGPVGPQGIQGLRGLTGLGLIGPTGSRGIPGVGGPTGPQGLIGPQGPAGSLLEEIPIGPKFALAYLGTNNQYYMLFKGGINTSGPNYYTNFLASAVGVPPEGWMKVSFYNLGNGNIQLSDFDMFLGFIVNPANTNPPNTCSWCYQPSINVNNWPNACVIAYPNQGVDAFKSIIRNVRLYKYPGLSDEIYGMNACGNWIGVDITTGLMKVIDPRTSSLGEIFAWKAYPSESYRNTHSLAYLGVL